MKSFFDMELREEELGENKLWKENVDDNYARIRYHKGYFRGLPLLRPRGPFKA